jgi:hypothetical protein
MVLGLRVVDCEHRGMCFEDILAVLDVMGDLHIRLTEHSKLNNALANMPSPNAHPDTVIVDGRLL